MLRLHSKGCEYAIRALIHLVRRQSSRKLPVSFGKLCHKTKTPEPSTRKVFQRMVRKGLLTAVPGRGGGYRLGLPPDKISVLSIIQTVDGPKALGGCVLGLPACGGRRPCPLHPTWKKTKQELTRELRSHTLLDLAKRNGRGSSKGGIRCGPWTDAGRAPGPR
ncbi:MAG: Rrf2 family transcriptional regulator [Candidatus Omnitrophica bacterium]|nr:Rrf2 family transcriptional regulator [Candidatus Omnitrophota bacterium]